MKKLLIIITFLFSLVDAADAGYSKPVELMGFQKQFLSMVNKGNPFGVSYLLGLINTSFLKADGEDLVENAFKFCKKHHHKHPDCAKIIGDWVDMNNDLDKDKKGLALDLDLIKYGLCICNILNNFDGINWTNFFRQEFVDPKMKADLRQRAISVIFAGLNAKTETTEKHKSEIPKIIKACELSGHSKFKDMILAWATDHKITIKSDWCLCHILQSNKHASVMDFADIVAAAKRTTENSPTVTPSSPNSSMITFVGVPVATDVGCC